METIINLLHRSNTRAFFLYICIGGLSSLINYVIFTLLYGLFHLHYQWALTIGYFSGAVANFMLNRQVTFQVMDKMHRQLIKYLILLLTNYYINLTIVYFLVDHLQYSPYVAVIISIGSTVMFTYIASKYWVYRSVDDLS